MDYMHMTLVRTSTGDPKTLIPGLWTSIRTRSMDYLMDWSTDPFYRPPLRTTPKNRRNVEVCEIVDGDVVSNSRHDAL